MAAALGLAGCFPGGCIAVGAAVLTPRGKRPIETLVPGDEVICIDPSTGSRVTGVICGTRKVKRETLRIAGDGWALRCTSDHPLYDPSRREWAPAGDWALGKRSTLLFVPDAGEITHVEVRERSVAAGVAELIDLSVDHELHDFVAEGVLVHNKPRSPFDCQLPDGGTQKEWSNCVCADDAGIGALSCNYDGTQTQCTSCRESPSDAGP